jgi:hypothetical protein
MKAHRYRLICWPLFAGFVIFFLSGKGIEGPDWPVSAIAAITTLAAIFASDPERRGSLVVRICLLGVALVAAADLLTTQFSASPDVAFLFLIAIFAVPLIKAAVHKRHLPHPD